MRRWSGGSRSLRRAVRFAGPFASPGRALTRGADEPRPERLTAQNSMPARFAGTEPMLPRFARAEPSAHPTDALLLSHPPLQLSELLLGRRVGVATRTLARETVEFRLKLDVVGKTQLLVSCTGAPGAGTGR
jgi:hypothetical protein